jgi:hypothetical protein
MTISSPKDTWTFLGQVGDRVLITAVTTSGSLNTETYLHAPCGSPDADTYAFGGKLINFCNQVKINNIT